METVFFIVVGLAIIVAQFYLRDDVVDETENKSIDDEGTPASTFLIGGDTIKYFGDHSNY